MVVASGTGLIGLVLLTSQSGGELIMRHDISPKYSQVDYESACGTAVFQVRFRNGPEERGRVDHLLINGRSVPGAAETLQMRAARRGIEGISIMKRGLDAKQPILLGVMNLGKAESQAAGMRWSLYFRISREGRQGWRISLD